MTPIKKNLKPLWEDIQFSIPSGFFRSRGERKHFVELMQTQWLSREELERLQLEKLKRLVSFAGKHVPFYRRIMKERKIRAEDFSSLRDLEAFPVIDKGVVLEHHGDFIPDVNLPSTIAVCTSGSSGRGLNFYWLREYMEIKGAANLRYENWAGKGSKGKTVLLTKPFTGKKAGKEFVLYPKRKAYALDTRKMDPESLSRIVGTISRLRPDFIQGFPASIYRVARHMQEGSIRLHHKVRAVLTTSELVSEDMRHIIEEGFQAPLRDWYGCIEGCASAGQCERGGYHISMEYCHVEFLPEGNMYRIVGTNLENLAFPLIRYDTEDIGEPVESACACGRGLKLMRVTGGRKSQIVKNRSGEIYFLPGFFSKILRVPVREYQVVQDSLEQVDIYIVPAPEFTDAHRKLILSGAKDYLGGEMRIRLRTVEKIDRGPGGKYSPVVCRV